MDLATQVQDEADAFTPLMMCAAPGVDPSSHIDALAKGAPRLRRNGVSCGL